MFKSKVDQLFLAGKGAAISVTVANTVLEYAGSFILRVK